MGEAMLSAAAGRLIGLIEEQARYHINLVIGAEEEVHTLAQELNTIRCVLDDAEIRRFNNHLVSIWLSKLERMTWEMEDVLDQWDYAILKHQHDEEPTVAPSKKKVWSFLPSSSCLCFKKVAVRHEIATKILNVKSQLDEISKEKDRYSFAVSQPSEQPPPKSWRDPSTSYTVVEEVIGRVLDCDTLVTKLMGDGGSLQVVSIVGVGGLGKTTLAQLVYNHSQLEKHFHLRIWVCVSDPFDMVAIAKGIIESVTKEDPPSTNNLGTLWQCVRDSISGKKILLVLDDVWTEEYGKWEPLDKNLRCCGEGSKILLTTRNKNVAKITGTKDEDIHYPGMLSLDDCWLLIRRISRLGKDEVEFEDTGKDIAKKCNGLPLAARTLGSLLRSKSSLEEWNVVLNNDVWEMKEAKVELFPHLLLSYNELSPSLKRCFSYCAIFPKDTSIDVGELIHNWMVLGYLGNDSSNIDSRGREYFNILAMHSLFQEIEKYESTGEIRCKMHDIVHDFAQFLRKSTWAGRTRINECTTCRDRDPSQIFTVNEFKSLNLDYEESPNLCECFTSLRVLSLIGCNLTRIPQILDKFIHLRRLNLSGNEFLLVDLQIIFKLYNLKTLSLGNCRLEEIPTEIGNLIHLRHLNLSGNSLEKFPETIHSLHELRTLIVKGCDNLCEFPDRLAQLSCLSSLTELEGRSVWSKLGLLKKLNHVGQEVTLRITFDCNDDLGRVVEDAREAELRNKIGIEKLVVIFEEDEMEEAFLSSDKCRRVMKDVTDALEPHPKLQQLSVWYYLGSQLPSWMVSPLNQLRNISVYYCRLVRELPSLGKLPCLEEILIYGMEELEIVGREFLNFHGSSSNISFPKLEILEINGSRKWKGWEDITAEEEASSACLVMPCLRRLMIIDCTGLIELPHCLLRKVSSLELLNISGSTQLQQRYMDKDDSDWKSILQSNPCLQAEF